MEGGRPVSEEVQKTVGELRHLKHRLNTLSDQLQELKRNNDEKATEIQRLNQIAENLQADLTSLKGIEEKHSRKLPTDILRKMEPVMGFEAISQEKVRQNVEILRLMVHELLLRTIHNETTAIRELADEEIYFQKICRDVINSRQLLGEEVEKVVEKCEKAMLKKRDLFKELAALEAEKDAIDAQLRICEATLRRLAMVARQLGIPGLKQNELAPAATSLSAPSIISTYDGQYMSTRQRMDNCEPCIFSDTTRSAGYSNIGDDIERSPCSSAYEMNVCVWNTDSAPCHRVQTTPKRRSASLKTPVLRYLAIPSPAASTSFAETVTTTSTTKTQDLGDQSQDIFK